MCRWIVFVLCLKQHPLALRWFHYFDQAIDDIDHANVMTKLPKTAMYFASLELKNQSGEVAQAEELKDRIICAIYYGPNGLKWNDFSRLKSARYSNQELFGG